MSGRTGRDWSAIWHARPAKRHHAQQIAVSLGVLGEDCEMHLPPTLRVPRTRHVYLAAKDRLDAVADLLDSLLELDVGVNVAVFC
jgi:hypothetical protein